MKLNKTVDEVINEMRMQDMHKFFMENIGLFIDTKNNK